MGGAENMLIFCSTLESSWMFKSTRDDFALRNGGFSGNGGGSAVDAAAFFSVVDFFSGNFVLWLDDPSIDSTFFLLLLVMVFNLFGMLGVGGGDLNCMDGVVTEIALLLSGICT